MHNYNNMKQLESDKEKIDNIIGDILNINLARHSLAERDFENAVISANEAVIALEELQETMSTERRKNV